VVPAVRTDNAIARMPRLSLNLAVSSNDIAAAQRLRHRVFVEEMGARPTVGSPGREQDLFDPWCEHLIVRDQTCGDVVGTYRMLTAENARRLGTFCAEREFDLTRLAHLGAWIGGEPAWDPDFNTADLLIFMPLTRAATRNARHFPQERHAA
jgi:putative hemolysin